MKFTKEELDDMDAAEKKRLKDMGELDEDHAPPVLNDADVEKAKATTPSASGPLVKPRSFQKSVIDSPRPQVVTVGANPRNSRGEERYKR